MSNYEIVTIKGENNKDMDMIRRRFKDILEYNLSGDSEDSFVLRSRGEWRLYREIEDMIENNELLEEAKGSLRAYYQLESEKYSRIYKINHNKNKTYLEDIEISYVFSGDFIKSEILNEISNYYKKIDAVTKIEEDTFYVNDNFEKEIENKFNINKNIINTRKKGSFIEVEIINGPLKNYSEYIGKNMTEMQEIENEDEFKDIKTCDLDKIPF